MANEYLKAVYDEMQDKLSLGSFDEFSKNIQDESYREAIKSESANHIDTTDFDINIGLKKKDVTTSGTQKLSPSSNTESASKSQKQSSVVDKIVNFQIPGVQGNTFKPLTEQQKIAGKNALGQGTAIVPEKKVQTPEVSAKKSAILKAVTGKDIDYEQISSISNPNNTNYTEILASQKEAPKSDNTLTTNPALKEEQRQKQVEQTEFIKNREFKVNNPQANIRILETKDPVLLKDVADKASDFDEIRIVESFNTDSPISKRFSMPSNDVPYKPFTDYLEVSELSTANPMELYETAEKEADRDKQLQYFKDRGKDNILNEFNNEQTAISYKQNLLKKKHETALNNLKQKYGEDINNVEIPQDDKDFVDIVAAQNGLRENYNQSKDLLKSEKYSEVNKMIQERANRQVEIDKDAKEDTWYKFTDEANKIQNVVMNTAYGLLNDIASLPRFVNGIAGGDKFNWTDKVADATQRFTDAGMAYFNTPTNLQRENVQDYAEVDGYRVFLDKKGNVQSIRDKDNFMVNDEVKKREISDKFDANKDKIKVKTDWVDGEQILNQSSKIIGDMLVMVAEGGGIGAGIKGAGKLSKSSRILNLAENAKLTTSLAVISQMQNEMMNDAIDKGMSKSDAAKYAAISSAGVAAISLINPMEAEFLKNIKNVKSLASEEVASFVNGGTTLADLSKKTIRNIIGNSIPEIAEEQFFEPALQNVVNDSYKSHIAEGQELQNTEILGRENLAQSVLTATTTFLPSITESIKNTNSNSVKMDILENPENWMAVMDKKKELGIIEDSEYTAEVSAMQKAKKKYDTLKSEVKQADRIKLAGLIGDKIAIESKLSDAPELKPKYEKQLSEIETKISNLTNGISDTEAPIEQATDVNIQVQDFGEENKQNTNKDESKTTSTESVNTGQKQDNITGVQQNEQNGGTIQQGNGQNESDQKEIQVTAEEKINPLESKIKKKIPTEKVEETVDEIVTPIRQLGTGANVYFETPKYRVNDTKDGKVLLNINGEEDGGMAIANIEFDNPNEAVRVAKKLSEVMPNGVKDGVLIDKVVEEIKNNPSYPNAPTTEVDKKTEVIENNKSDKNEFQYVIDKANKNGSSAKVSGTKKTNLSDKESAILYNTIEKLEAKAIKNNSASFDENETLNINYENINGKEQKINTYNIDGYTIKYKYNNGKSFTEITTPQGDLIVVSKQYGKTEIAYLGRSEAKSADVESPISKTETTENPIQIKAEENLLAELVDNIEKGEKYDKDLVEYFSSDKSELFKKNGVPESLTKALGKKDAEKKAKEIDGVKVEEIKQPVYKKQESKPIKEGAEGKLLIPKDGNTVKVGEANEKFKKANKVEGEDTTIEMPNGETRSAKFVVVELDDIMASHDENSFNNTDGYPSQDGQNVNPRNYKDDVTAKAKVINDAKNLKPSIVISDAVTPDTGAPIISSDGIVLSGNGRTMAIKRSVSDAPEKYNEYKEQLIKKANKFGLDSEQVSKMKNPILVKIDNSIKDYSVKGLDEYNQKAQKGENPIDKAIKRSAIINSDERLKGTIINIISGHETMSDLFANNKDRKAIIGLFIENGIITKQESNEYINDDGTLTDNGKDLINDVLLATMVSPETMKASESVKAFRNKIINALPVLTTNYNNAEYSLENEINGAIKLQAELVASGYKQEDFWDFVNQVKIGEPHDPNVVLINRLISSGERNFKDFVVSYNESTSLKDGGLFGDSEVMSKQEVLDKLKEIKLNEDEKKIIAGVEDIYGAFANERQIGNVEVPKNEKGERIQKGEDKLKDELDNINQGELDLSGKELIGDALDRIVDKIGGKKNLTEQEKTSLTKDITDLAKGLLQEGKATIDNIIDKIKEYIKDEIKKRGLTANDKEIDVLAEQIEQKVIFSEGVKWYKDNGYTYEQTKKRLDEIDADYTEQELKDAWDGDSKKGKEKALQNRAYRGTTDEELKSMINDYGLTYETESQIIAESEANDIIERIGLDNAFQAVQNGYIKGAQAAVIYAKVVDDVEAKLQKGDLTEQEQTKLKEIQAFLIDMFDSEARDAGRFIAMLKRTNHKSLFNYDTMVKYAEESKGKPLTEEEKLQIKEQSEKIKELDKRIAELETELEEERVNNAIQNIKAQTQKNKVSVTFRAKSKGLADKVRKLKTKELVLKDADGNPIKLTQNSIVSYNDIIELVAKTIEKTGELIDGINTALDEIKKQEWYQKLSQRDKDAVDKQVKQDILDLDDDVSDDKFKIPHSLIRDIVKNGTEDIDGIVKKVLEVYQDIFPDLDERKIRDIITKYGEKVDDKRDTIDKKISLAKRIGRLLSAKDDLLNGKLPERSGLQRDKPNPQERLLMQEIQQLLKNIPKSQEEIDALWTSALEKVKARYKNRIEELQLAIDKAERIKKTKNVQNYNDADLDKLKEQLKQKQSEYDEKFPKEKTTLSDEQRLNQIINSKKKRLEFLKQQRIDKVYERTKKDGVDKSKYPELSKQIADLEAQIKAENEDIKKDEDYKKYIEKKRIALAIKANQRRIEELQRRIKEKDFTVKKNPTPVSDELNKVKKEKQKIVDDYEHAKHKFELENRTGWQKIFDGIIEALSFTKQAKATFDLSAPLRQGATVMFSNPMIFGKAIKEMHRQAWSDEFYKETIEKIQDSENYTLAQDSGLEITDVDSINERKRDEQYVSKLMDSEFMKKAPIFSHYRAMNKGSERAYSGFLNNIRFNLFEQGVKELELAGYKFEDNPVMFKSLATTINNLTGRGLSPSGKIRKVLNFFLFSPKMLTSRFLLAYDLFRKDIPFNSPSRKMAAKSLLGTVAWIGMFNVLGSVVSKALSDDDEEKKKSLLKKINYNPIATDFAKVRDKQTTFDPTAGYAPLVRTLARIASEKSINASGAEKDLTKGYGSNRFSPFWEFMENKLSPIASFGVSVATHKNPANKFEKSDNAEWYDYLTPLFVPLTAMQISENWNDKDNFGKDFIELGLGLYGIGVQQYDNTGTGKDKSNSRTSERGTTRENTSRTTSRTTNR